MPKKRSAGKPARPPRKARINKDNYMSIKHTNYVNRQRRHAKIRKKVTGTKVRPRLSVFRSARYLYLQLIDDQSGRTLAATTSKSVKVDENGDSVKNKTRKIALAFTAGGRLAAKAKELNVNEAVFDRGGYRYHGRVKAAAEGARAGGLKL